MIFKFARYVIIFFSTATMSYYSQFGQDKLLNDLFFNNKKNGVFIDIGAHDGVFLNNTFFFEKTLGWTGICIEPLPSEYKKLVNARSCICINGCIDKDETAKDFLIINSKTEPNVNTLSGLKYSYQKDHYNYLDDRLKDVEHIRETIKVECFKLNNLLEKYNLKYIDYISIDTEGNELEILKSINFEEFYFYIVDVENNYINPEIRELMTDKGFKFVTRIGVDDVFVNTKTYTN